MTCYTGNIIGFNVGQKRIIFKLRKQLVYKGFSLFCAIVITFPDIQRVGRKDEWTNGLIGTVFLKK